MGPGNTNQGGWEGAGWVLHLPTHPACTPPRVLPLHRTPAAHRTLRCSQDHTAVSRSTKEILGVRYTTGRPQARHGCVGLLPPPYAMALRPAPVRLLRLILSISQYFSVFSSDPSMLRSQYAQIPVSQSPVCSDPSISDLSIFFSILPEARCREPSPATRSSCRINEERLAVLDAGVLIRAAAGSRL